MSEPQTEQRDTAKPITVLIASRENLVEGCRQNPEGAADNIIRAYNHAERLAEALKTVFVEYKRGICEIDASVCIKAREALAAWEGAQK